MKKWNVVKNFYEKNSKMKVNQAVKKRLLKQGYFVVSFDEAKMIKEKYYEMGKRNDDLQII